MNQKGFIPLLILVGVAIAGLVWVTLLYVKTYQTSNPIPTPLASPIQELITPTPLSTPSLTIRSTIKLTTRPTSKPTASSLINCTGPDGKQFKTTQTECDNFNKLWAPTPTSTPTTAPVSAPVTGCGAYNLGGDLGQLVVNIQPQSGQTLVGDAYVTMSDKYSGCTGVDPGFPYGQVIKQGSTSVTFSGMRPGPFVVTIQYHTHTYTNDVNIQSGNNSITVTVDD